MAEKECVPVLSSTLKGDKAVVASGSRNEVSGERRELKGNSRRYLGSSQLGEGRCYWYLLGRETGGVA